MDGWVGEWTNEWTGGWVDVRICCPQMLPPAAVPDALGRRDAACGPLKTPAVLGRGGCPPLGAFEKVAARAHLYSWRDRGSEAIRLVVCGSVGGRAPVSRARPPGPAGRRSDVLEPCRGLS